MIGIAKEKMGNATSIFNLFSAIVCLSHEPYFLNSSSAEFRMASSAQMESSNSICFFCCR